MTDNPDLNAIAGDETITVRRAALAALFDLAVGSLDFGSSFWDTADTIVAREIAETLGVCVTNATPSDHMNEFPPCDCPSYLRSLQAYSDMGYNEPRSWASHSHGEALLEADASSSK